ncbi:MAG: hypothetical protein BWY81_01114 [Firmicutes bacterium ADurb.Bin467]|nr:MAG: hypothetical protein BWY81_01114 [Firmicutes bacterium ADurb.Bin467]
MASVEISGGSRSFATIAPLNRPQRAPMASITSTPRSSLPVARQAMPPSEADSVRIAHIEKSVQPMMIKSVSGSAMMPISAVSMIVPRKVLSEKNDGLDRPKPTISARFSAISA